MEPVSALGLLVFAALAWAMGRSRRALNVRLLVWGFALQLGLGLMVFRTRIGHTVLVAVNDAVNALLDAAADGPRFVVGALADAGVAGKAGLGFLLFFQGLLAVVVISALLQVLYHLGVMGWLVRLSPWCFPA